MTLLSSLLHNVGSLLNLGSKPLDGLLNCSIAWLGNPGLISVDLIFNKDIHILELFPSIFHGSLYKSDACFCLSIDVYRTMKLYGLY